MSTLCKYIIVTISNQLLSLLLTKMFESQKFYISYNTIIRQAVYLIYCVQGKNYLKINTFPANSNRIRGKILSFIIKSY